MSLLYLQSHIAMSFNLEHINILFHAFSVSSSELLCLFLYLCFCPGHSLIQNRQFYFDSYLYVKCEGKGCGGVYCHCSRTLLFAETAFFFPSVQDILSVDQRMFLTIHSHLGKVEKKEKRRELTHFQATIFLTWIMSFLLFSLPTYHSPIRSLQYLIIFICDIYDAITLTEMLALHSVQHTLPAVNRVYFVPVGKCSKSGHQLSLHCLKTIFCQLAESINPLMKSISYSILQFH